MTHVIVIFMTITHLPQKNNLFCGDFRLQNKENDSVEFSEMIQKDRKQKKDGRAVSRHALRI